jgi:DNA ligase-1
MRDLLSQIQEIKSATSKKEKMRLLRVHDSPALRKLIFAAFSPTVVLGIGTVDFDDRPEDAPKETTLEEILTFINEVQSRKIKGNASKDVAWDLADRTHAPYRWITAGILGGNLRIGCDAKVINKVLPGLIPTLDIQLAEELHPDHLDFPGYASPKLDGMRCLAVVTRQGVRLFSRGGKAIECVPHIEAALKKLPLGYYDGELLHPAGFAATMRFCRSKIAKPGSDAVRFHIFDYIVEHEWDNPEMDAKSRFGKLKSIFATVESPSLVMVEHTLVIRNSDLLRLHKQFVAAGYEGTMFQHQGAYVRKRGWHLQKLKDFKSSEGRVIALIEGTGKNRGKTGSVRLKDLKTNVEFDLGSGFTDEERAELTPGTLGKIIEYRYQELTEDGVPRFPTFLRYRPDLS